MTTSIFEVFGYHVDYYVNSRYVGHIKIDQPDREQLGYSGRQHVQLAEPIQVTRSGGATTILPVGLNVTTECIPLCGKIKGDVKQRWQILREHYNKLPRKQ
jgi:hypothetical protein